MKKNADTYLFCMIIIATRITFTVIYRRQYNLLISTTYFQGFLSKALLADSNNGRMAVLRARISSRLKSVLLDWQSPGDQDVPNLEWWDSVILNGDLADDELDQMDTIIKNPPITNLVEHPTGPPSKYRF